MAIVKKPHQHAEVIKAWADGAQIQYEHFHGGWIDCTEDEPPSWSLQRKYRVKPEPPAKVYPETRISDDAMREIFKNVPIGGDCFTEIANAALRHAVDNGYLMLPGGQLDDETILAVLKVELEKEDIFFFDHGKRAVLATIKSLLVTEPEIEKLRSDLARAEEALKTKRYITEELTYEKFNAMHEDERAARDMAIAEAVRDAARNASQSNFVGGITPIVGMAYRRISSLDLAAIIASVKP